MQLSVRIVGGEPAAPQVMSCTGSISRTIESWLPNLTNESAILLHAQVGAGKTHAVLHTIYPWARKNGLRVLFVSSRVAINTQVKESIISLTGEVHLKEEHTTIGLRRQADFEGISVVTYHTLYHYMLHEPNRLKDFGILVFDEVHALVADALFVPCSGYVLQNLTKVFGGIPRIYFSATPEPVLPALCEAEAPYPLTILRFRQSYGYVRPKFFHSEEEIAHCINTDNGGKKWLIYVPTIQQGTALQSRLTCSVRLLNSRSREESPEAWETLLTARCFPEKVAIATAVIDAGVSFIDDELSNVVVFETDVATLTQVLGRKRRKVGETVNLYVWCPDGKDVAALDLTNRQMQDALDMWRTNRATFVERYLLRPTAMDLRGLFRTTISGQLELNPLAQRKLDYDRAILQRLIKRMHSNHGDPGFDKLMVNCLHLRDVDFQRCWLDDAKNGEGRTKLEQLVCGFADRNLEQSQFAMFADAFRDQYIRSFGTGKGGKDRGDRPWGSRKIADKLAELHIAAQIQENKPDKTFRIIFVGGTYDKDAS